MRIYVVNVYDDNGRSTVLGAFETPGHAVVAISLSYKPPLKDLEVRDKQLGNPIVRVVATLADERAESFEIVATELHSEPVHL